MKYLAFTQLLISTVFSSRILVFNDMHLNLTKDGYTCSFGNCLTLGSWNWDSSFDLVQTVINEAKNDPPDAILLLGDFVVHDLTAVNDGAKFEILKETWN